MAKELWVLTAALHADDGVLLAAVVGVVDAKTEAKIKDAELLEVEAIIKLIRAGKKLVAVYPANNQRWTVKVVTLPDGRETIETVPSGKPGYRTMAQLYSLDDLVALSEQMHSATRH